MMMNEPRAFRPLAEQVAHMYGITSPDLSFIRHNENVAYRVRDVESGGSYLLRVNFGRTEGFRRAQQEVAAIRSELQWLAALSRDTDIIVQRPVENRDGDLVTVVENPLTGEPVACTLLTWIEAAPFKQDAPDAPALVFNLGVLQRRLHEHARHWEPPVGFERPFYDEALLERSLRDLAQGVDSGLIGRDAYRHVEAASEHIRGLFEQLRRTRDVWGLIHADLPPNLLVRGDTVIPIDFSLSGFGYFYLDMGICACNLKKPLRHSYFDGYGPALSDDVRHYVEAFTIMIILVTAAREVNNPDWAEWFGRRFPIIANIHCPQLVRREEFIFEI